MGEGSPERGEARTADRVGVARAMQLSADERVLWSAGPSVFSIVLRPLGWLIAIALMAWGGGFVLARVGASAGSRELLWGGAVLIALRLLWEVAVCASRSYALTDRRVVTRSGVFRRSAVELPLERVQVSALRRSLRERLCGLGTIGFASSGTGMYEVVWMMVSAPGPALALARAEIDARSQRTAAAGSQHRRSATDRPLVIGLTGGIGAGKSLVAQMLAEEGCLVLDSDAQARIAMDRADVRDAIRSWWGDPVFDAEGRVDRSAVASIVFADRTQRARLESLIHPIIAEHRRRAIAEARSVPAVIVDAPLLFEAGVDRECDAVLFVDAAREIRWGRVAAARGWSEAEFARRERGQMPVEQKRERSRYIVRNEGTPDELRAETRRVLRSILRESGSRTVVGPIG